VTSVSLPQCGQATFVTPIDTTTISDSLSCLLTAALGEDGHDWHKVNIQMKSQEELDIKQND